MSKYSGGVGPVGPDIGEPSVDRDADSRNDRGWTSSSGVQGYRGELPEAGRTGEISRSNPHMSTIMCTHIFALL